jgi:anti-sigma B factor antagonist
VSDEQTDGATFESSVGSTPGTSVLAVSGEVDVATSPQLRRELHAMLDSGSTEVVVDFSGTTFVDSSGLGVLVGAYKRLRDSGTGTIRIVGTQPSVRKVFEITGLDAALLTD